MERARIPETRRQVPVWFLIALMSLMFLTATGFLYLGARLAPGSNLPSEELRILSRAYDHIDRHYIYDLTPDRRADLLHAAISGMLSELDDYSRYYPPKRSEDYSKGTLGIMTGIGVVVQSVDGRVYVAYPSPGGPADLAGLKVGDIITKVDGAPVDDSNQAVEQIKGELDTEVVLTVTRDEAAMDITVKRERVTIPSVKWARILDADKGIGYVYLEKFADHTAKELDISIQHLEGGLGRLLSGLVLDLRQNPGGLLETCLEITNRFLESGTIVTLKRRTEQDIRHDADPAKCTKGDLPLVILLDEGSASASEVLSGALQDHGRTRIVGVRSFGKGVVQSVFSWADRKERLKITTSYYLTPKGRNIENILRPDSEQGHGGIEPDVEVGFASKKQRRDVLTRLLRREVPRKYADAVRALHERIPEIDVSQPADTDEDPQLARALAEIRQMIDAKDAGK